MTSPLPLLAEEQPRSEQQSSRQQRSVLLYGSISLLLLGPLAFGGTDAVAIFLFRTGVCLLSIVWAVQQLKRRIIRIYPNILFWPMLCFALLAAIQLAAGLTSSKARTLSVVMLYGSYGLICFLLVQTLRRASQIEIIARIVSIYGATVALFAMLQDLASRGKLYWFISPQAGGWIYGPYVNHNHYAGLMEMLTPVPLIVALSPRIPSETRWQAGGAASIMAASLFFCGSRGGMVAFGAEIVLLAMLLPNKRRRHKRFRIPAALILTALVIGYASWSAGIPEIDSFASAFVGSRTADLSAGVRLTIDRDTLRMFRQRPLLGWGLGTFEAIYPQFCSFYTNLSVDRAHNDYLQLLAETGIAGLIITVWFLFIALRGAMNKVLGDRSSANRLVGLSVLLGIAGILVHSLVDFNLEIPANAAIFYALCTIAAMKHRFGLHKHGQPGLSNPKGDSRQTRLAPMDATG